MNHPREENGRQPIPRTRLTYHDTIKIPRKVRYKRTIGLPLFHGKTLLLPCGEVKVDREGRGGGGVHHSGTFMDTLGQRDPLSRTFVPIHVTSYVYDVVYTTYIPVYVMHMCVSFSHLVQIYRYLL